MELVRFPSRGGFSVRSIFTFALTVIITALLWVVLTPPTTHAAPNITWTDGGTILYDEHGYTLDESFQDPTGTIPAEATVYKAPVQTQGSNQELMVLYFAPGVDPPTATTATHVIFDYKSGDISNPHDSKSVSATPKGSDGSLAGEVNSSCSVGGIGWIVCPVSVFLAESMDNLFNIIDDLIRTQPLMIGNEDNAMYTAWGVSRTIANVAFVIVFLVIIFSQLTSLGVSNYGLKKLVPRLIVAAVLVNVSYYICAIAIDVSNIIGYSIHDVFRAIREDVFHMTSDNFADVNNNPWTAVTAVVLGGGGLIGGVYYVVTAGPYILITLLVGLGLVALFVLLVLAARQAIIIILVIIAPLAFVANLLPNTEKWFEKWKDLFATMLIFFPAFSLVFAGSQLAGQLIIQNAGDNIITVIFGLAVQVAPLVVTPYLLKFSGGLLGRIAQIANNPRKGIMDRTKGWQHEKSEIQRLRMMSSKRPAAKPFQLLDNNRRARKSLTESYQKNADSRWEEEKRYKKLSERAADADDNRARVHSNHERHINELRAGAGHSYSKKFDLHTRALEAEEAKVGAEAANAQLSALTSEYRSGKYDTQGNQRLEAIQKNMAKNVMRTTAYNRAAEGASIVQQFEYAQEITKLPQDAKIFDDGKTLVELAQGVDPNGKQRAQASATAIIQEIRAKTIDNTAKIIMHKNPSNDQLVQLAQGVSTIDGITVTQDAVAAAIQLTLGGPDTGAIGEALKTVDLSFSNYGFSDTERQELQILAGKALESNSSKPPFASAGVIAMLKQGKAFNGTDLSAAYGTSGVNDWIIDIINKKKIDSGKLQGAGNDYAKLLLDAVSTAPAGSLTADALVKLRQHLDITLDPSREAFEKLGDSQETLEALQSLLPPAPPGATPPTTPPTP